eukprot:2751118-Pleurochrysis_carterae.AAC.3
MDDDYVAEKVFIKSSHALYHFIFDKLHQTTDERSGFASRIEIYEKFGISRDVVAEVRGL